MSKLSEKFFEVLNHEGVVSIMSWGVEPHLVNTWNSYLVVTKDERILIPAYGFRKTEKNVDVNNKVKISLGSKEVSGYKDYPGTGFVVDGTAAYIVDVCLMRNISCLKGENTVFTIRKKVDKYV